MSFTALLSGISYMDEITTYLLTYKALWQLYNREIDLLSAWHLFPPRPFAILWYHGN